MIPNADIIANPASTSPMRHETKADFDVLITSNARKNNNYY